MLLLTVLFILGCCCCCFGNSAQVSPGERQVVHPPTVFIADPRALVAARADHAAAGSTDSKLSAPIKKLLDDARKALRVTPPAVTDKKRQGPGNDSHDFLSFAPYFWLDKETGKYVRRDGERNPEADEDGDNVRFGTVCKTVYTLGLAYYVTNNETYAVKAALMVRRFFLDEATKMNPNLNFGQVVPGTTTGRKEGIIGVRCIVELIDAFGMLEGSKTGWIANDRQGMQDWMSDFLDWLTTSKLGLAEGAARNNHGSFYDTIVASISLFLGRTDLARKTILQAGPDRIARQIQPDGKQPAELKRTKSFEYSLFNLEALSNLASMGKNAGIDLWSYGQGEKPDQSLLQAAIEFVAPYMDESLTWPFQQITSIGKKRIALAELLLQVAINYPTSEVIAKALKIANDEKLIATTRKRLLFIAPSL